MTENTLAETPTPESPLTDTLPALTAGQLIRAARQKLGLHLAVLSVTLKVPVRQLEALEADQHDPSKGSVFIRALASSVCRQLQMDPVPVLALLPQAPGQMLLRQDSIAPMQSARSWCLDIKALFGGLPRQTLSIAALMLALTAALLWMPSPSTWVWLQPDPVKTVVLETSAPVPEASAIALTETQAPAIESASAVVQPTAAVAALVPVPTASVPAALSKPLPAPAPSNGAALGFMASQDSWIEVRDSKNMVLWSRLVHAGETAQVNYPLPLRVVIGRADAVNVTYQGKPFDLAPHTKATVARFEVNE
jgi:cytoskeleton protein RodZ